MIGYVRRHPHLLDWLAMSPRGSSLAAINGIVIYNIVRDNCNLWNSQVDFTDKSAISHLSPKNRKRFWISDYQLAIKFDFNEANSLPPTAAVSEDGIPALLIHNTISIGSSNTVMLRVKADTWEGLRDLHN